MIKTESQLWDYLAKRWDKAKMRSPHDEMIATVTIRGEFEDCICDCVQTLEENGLPRQLAEAAHRRIDAWMARHRPGKLFAFLRTLAGAAKRAALCRTFAAECRKEAKTKH